MKKLKLLLFTLLISLTLACRFSGASGAKKNPPSASKAAADLQIASRQEVSGDHLLSVSPDGRWYIAQGEAQVCYGDAASLKQAGCVDFHAGIDGAGIAWSPDSTQAAFTENAYIYLYEADLWVLNMKTGVLIDLTNDGYQGGLFQLNATATKNGDDLPVDTSPTWSPDGKWIAFVRSNYSNTKNTAFYKIHATGGKPEKVLTINPGVPFVVYRPARWISDGKKLVYSVWVPGKGNPDNGVWIAGSDGKNPRQLLAESQDWGVPLVMDLSAKGDKALIQYSQASQTMITQPNQSFIQILDLNTGATTPLKATTSASPEFYSPSDAVFSPDGSKIVYYYQSAVKAQSVIAVRDTAGTAEQILDQPDWPLYYQPSKNLHALYWTEQDTLFVQTKPDGGWWLTIASK